MRILFVLLSFWFCFSCTKLETGLQLAPRVVTYKVDEAFDFKSEKLDKLRKQIEMDVNANKKELALKLISHIDAILELSKKEKVAAADVQKNIEALKLTQAQTVQNFKASFDVALADLQTKEIEHFKIFNDKKSKRDFEKTEDKKYFLKDRKQTILKTLGYFFDRITDEQENLCEQMVDKHYDYFIERLKIRKTFADSFHLKLTSKQPAVDFVIKYYGGDQKEFGAGPIKAYLEDYYRFQADFWNMTSEKEKQNFRKNMNSYKDELKKIAGI
ncbi:MAG: hypothetical protein H7061_10920 [Bdellovibrionaceae bacterium]|nr:hypothetical protein [Bdellovibrio sp.]